jgi:hypothetical protein
MSSLGEELPKELARVRKILGHYKEIGSAGIFGATMIEQALQRTDKAVISGDVVEMIRCYKELQGFKE